VDVADRDPAEIPSTYIEFDGTTGLIRYAWFEEVYDKWTRCIYGVIPPIPFS
jgi:hypothetical protein